MREGWDLGDLYRGAMSLRSTWIRLRCLRPDAPLFAALREDEELEAEQERNAAIDDALNRYRPRG